MASLEKVLINSEEQIRALFDSILIPTYVWQKVGDFFQLIDYNKATYDYSHGAVEKYLGMKASEIYRERLDVLKNLNDCFNRKTTFTLEAKYYFNVFKEERDLIVKFVYLPPDLVLVHTEDITERRRVEQKLKESEEKFREIAEQSFMAISVIQDGVFKYFNARMAEVNGYSMDEIKNWKPNEFAKIIHPEDREFVMEQARKKQTGDPNVINQYPFRIIQKDGEIRWLEIFSKTINYEGSPANLTMSIDTTDKINTEHRLKESEKKFRTIFEAIPDLYFLVSEDTTILDYKGKEQEFYVTPEEFRGKKLVDLVPQYLGTKTVEQVKKTLRTQEPQIYEYELEMKDKVHFYEARYFYFSKNQVSIFIRDITKRKNAEKQIIDLAKFPSENPYPVLRVTKEKVIYINKSGQNLLDLTESSVIPNFFKEQIINAFNENIVKTLEANFNGQIYSFNIVPIKQEGYANIYGQDITERIKSENALNKEKKFTEDIFNSSMDTIFVFEPETGKAHRWNKVFNDVSGYNDEEISLMKTPDSYYSEEDLKRAAVASKIILNEGKTTVEMSLITKDGKKIPYEYTGRSFKSPDGKNLIVSVGRDITERIEAEEKLIESEKNYRELYEWAPNAYFSIRQDKTLIKCNIAAEKLLGYTKEELYKMKVFDLYANTENGLEKAQELFKLFLVGENIQDQELQMRKKGGENIWISLTVVPILNQAGNVIESRSMVLDINERKLAQEKLENSYEQLREMEYIINNSPGVVFLWQNSEGWPVEFVSENVIQFGYTPEEFYSGKVIYKDIIHPDDVGRVSEEVNYYTNEGVNDFVQEYRILTKSGKIKWFDDRTWIRRDSEGNITHFQGIVFDITDRKTTEEALKVSEKKYQEAFERASFYKDLFAHDINNILQVITSSAELISYQLDNSEDLKDIGNIANIIRKQVQKGAKLVRNVRTLSELDDSESLLEPIEGMTALKNSIKFIHSAYSERNIKVKVDTFANMFSVRANELLQEIFDNILINAIKYNENSPVDIQIKITKIKSENENYIKMEFLDNGIGIQDNKKKVLFKEGYRHLEGSKGLGVGLSLVSKILKSYNGKILVEDKVKGDYKKGSNFIVLLPEAN